MTKIPNPLPKIIYLSNQNTHIPITLQKINPLSLKLSLNTKTPPKATISISLARGPTRSIINRPLKNNMCMDRFSGLNRVNTAILRNTRKPWDRVATESIVRWSKRPINSIWIASGFDFFIYF